MPLSQTLDALAAALHQTAPQIASRLQLGLTAAEINQQVAAFAWTLPQDAGTLYQWHNGLSGQAENLNLAEKFLRLKGKWHGELTGRENEIHLRLTDTLLNLQPAHPVVIKFLPLDYALAGHRHLKLGRCPLNLLPIAVLQNGATTLYGLLQLDPEQSTLYWANGTNLPPVKVTAAFLATQPQFAELRDFAAFLTECCQQALSPSALISANPRDKAVDAEVDVVRLAQVIQQ